MHTPPASSIDLTFVTAMNRCPFSSELHASGSSLHVQEYYITRSTVPTLEQLMYSAAFGAGNQMSLPVLSRVVSEFQRSDGEYNCGQLHGAFLRFHEVGDNIRGVPQSVYHFCPC